MRIKLLKTEIMSAAARTSLYFQFLLGITFFGISAASGTIAQTSSVAEIGAVSYDVLLLGGDYLCGGLAAIGPLVGLNVSFSFNRFGDTEAWPSDMFMLMQTVDIDGVVVDCYQYGGYDTNVFI